MIKNDALGFLIGLTVFAGLSGAAANAQLRVVTLDSCLANARRNYPLLQQKELTRQSTGYQLSNLRKSNLPQVQIAGQATYQSEVTQLPIDLPQFDLPDMSKDQYRIYGEVSQPITGWFTIGKRSDVLRSRMAVSRQRTEVALYPLNRQVQQLYFGILLAAAQLKETELMKQEIQTGINQTNVAVANGAAVASDVDLLHAALLKAGRKAIALQATRKGYLNQLATLTGLSLTKDTRLRLPPQPSQPHRLHRPELRLYDQQQNALAAQQALLDLALLPRLSVFVRGGWGRPGLNMLDNDFQAYYLGGLRLSWPLSGFYTLHNDRKLLDLKQQQIRTQQQTFILNTRLGLQQQSAEINKIRQMIAADREIVGLREQITETTRHRLQYGTATANDYLLAVNAENQARQTLQIHKIQLLMAGYQLRITAGYPAKNQQ